jgi:hypothetical protein
MLLNQLVEESAKARYIVTTSNGDGPEFVVVNSIDDIEKELGQEPDYILVTEFQGEILGMGMSGHGEVYYETSGKNKDVFHYEQGEVYTNDIGLKIGDAGDSEDE